MVLPANQDENADFVKIFTNSGSSIALIGLNDAKSPDDWVDNDGQTFNGWSNWRENSPNKAGTFMHEVYAYGVVEDDGMWKDWIDRSTKLFCQKPALAASPAQPATATEQTGKLSR